MKVLFINDSASNPNWGDRAAAISLKKMIKDVGGKIIYNITEEEIYQSNFNKKQNEYSEKKQTSQAKIIIKQFIPPFILSMLKIIRDKLSKFHDSNIIPENIEDFKKQLIRLGKKREHWQGLHNAIQNSDVAIIHGDGSMTGNGIHPRSLLFLSYIIKKEFNKPVVILNHTGDFSDSNLREIAESIYPLFDDVVFRDIISLKKCKNMCKARFSPDSAFIFKPIERIDWLKVARRLSYFDIWPDKANFNPEKKYICIGGSSIYPYLPKKFDPIHGYRHLIKHLLRKYHGQILLTVSDGQDQKIFRPISKELNLPLIGMSTPVQQAVDIVGNAEAYIGGRWHPGIFALRGGTPVIPIASVTFKMEALVEMAGLGNLTFDALNLDREKEKIFWQVKKYIDQGEKLRSRLRVWAERQSEKAYENIRYLYNYK